MYYVYLWYNINIYNTKYYSDKNCNTQIHSTKFTDNNLYMQIVHIIVSSIIYICVLFHTLLAGANFARLNIVVFSFVTESQST